MKLTELLTGFQYEVIQGSLDKEIADFGADSRKVSRGSLFVCIEGAAFDGHTFAGDAAALGAAAIVVAKDVAEQVKGSEVTVIRVEDTRYAMAFMSAAWFGHPADKLKIVGITGTKGKTTTSYLVKNMLQLSGIKCGLIGTIETVIGDKVIPAKNTTPDAFVLQKTFAEMAESGIEAVVMEVSSQALMQHRTQGFIFDYGVFTNLEPDHIGPNEHASFEEYTACKGLLFKQCKVGIVNGDDSHMAKVTEGHTCNLETFGIGGQNDLRAENIRLLRTPGQLGIGFTAKGSAELEANVSTPGRFSVYNALCAIAVCRHFGVSEGKIQEALARTKVKGRMERVDISDKYTLYIDYAHNAMALESILTTLKEYNPGRLVCLFGCGGNRSKLRRFEMGEVSGKLAELTVITSDNPRDEEPADIIADIKTGIDKTCGEYIEIPDRREAIAYVISHAKENDLIILAGKGHEDYQEIKGVKYPMDERVIIRELLEAGLTTI